MYKYVTNHGNLPSFSLLDIIIVILVTEILSNYNIQVRLQIY